MKKKCELCNSSAKMYCDSDQASLCWDCDTKVHTANFLVAKHLRTLLCHSCQSPTPWTASGPKLGPTVSVCQACAHRRANRVDGHHDFGNTNRDDDDNDDGDEGDRDGNDDGEEDDDDSGDDDSDEDDGDNQVVPLSSISSPPPLISSTSSSEDSTKTSSHRRDGVSNSRIGFFSNSPEDEIARFSYL